MNITAIYYDNETPKEELIRIANDLSEAMPENRIIAIPKNYDLLLNCTIDQLVSIRTIIDTALAIMVSPEKVLTTPNNVLPTVEETLEKEENKIIKFSDYLS